MARLSLSWLRACCAIACSTAIGMVILPVSLFAEIDGGTKYSLDLTDSNRIPTSTQWSNPDVIAVSPKGLGWGNREGEGSRSFWLKTQPIGIGYSWRPTSIARIKVTVDATGTPSGMLYVRYSADSKHWTTWQYLEALEPSDKVFQGTLRVPSAESAHYHELRLAYARRVDVSWSSDEEALVKEIVEREPNFFGKTTPFIGYVQFLYETELHGGQRLKGLDVSVNWFLGGKRLAPKVESAWKERDTVWRYMAH